MTVITGLKPGLCVIDGVMLFNKIASTSRICLAWSRLLPRSLPTASRFSLSPPRISAPPSA
jgi:hypothetical protein